MAKKKKRSPEEMHRQIQSSLEALPYAIADHEKKGQRGKAFILRRLSGPMLRLMNRAFGARRYRGTEGEKLRQTEQMRRHLEKKQAAIRHVQNHTQAQKKRKKAK